MRYFYTPAKKIFKFGQYTTSDKEIKDLTKAWILIGLSFGIFMVGGIKPLFANGILSINFIENVVLALIAVGLGFLLHELGHKIVAQYYGLQAEFRSFDNMLWLGLIIASFLSFLFIAPGAVMIQGKLTKRENGHISITGPLINIALALIFIAIPSIFILIPFLNPLTGFTLKIFTYGAMINSWLALFNMIPFGMFDGKKVLAWNKPIYYTTLIATILLVFG